MHTDELIARLTNELYDLKYKMADIRIHAETAYYNFKSDHGMIKYAEKAVIEILNLIDVEGSAEN